MNLFGDTFKNNVLFLLEKNQRTLKELQRELEMEPIQLLAIIDGKVNPSFAHLKTIAEFFGITHTDLLEPLTEDVYALFHTKEERNTFEADLVAWQEHRLNQPSSIMNQTWTKKRQYVLPTENENQQP